MALLDLLRGMVHQQDKKYIQDQAPQYFVLFLSVCQLVLGAVRFVKRKCKELNSIADIFSKVGMGLFDQREYSLTHFPNYILMFTFSWQN